MIDKILGKWQLSVEDSQIEFGEQPESGVLSINTDDGFVALHIKLIDGNQHEKNVHFEQLPDGQYHPTLDEHLGDESMLKIKSDNELEAVIMKDSKAYSSFSLLISADNELQLEYNLAAPNLDIKVNRFVFIR